VTERRIAGARLRLELGDITRSEADAIVNAANEALVGGGGVDGAIHRAGGPAIMEACRRIGGCPTGSAVITEGGALHARYVIHAVAPRYSGRAQDAMLLHQAYSSALRLADEHALRTVAFPSLGTGAYGYPIGEASQIALQSVARHLRTRTRLERVTFVLFSEGDLSVYREALASLANR